jgi:YVTN family beta-propeller protein
VRTIPTDGPPQGVYSDGQHVWVTSDPNGNTSPGYLDEIDASTGAQIGSPIQVGDGCGAVNADGRYVWVANSDSGTVTQINESNRRIIRNVGVGQGDNSVHDDGLHTWIGNSQDGNVVEVNDSNGGINARFGLRGNGVYGITS